jgi:dihydroorotate dehydrogenase
MLELEKWQDRGEPFQISIALDGATLEEQLAEAREICKLLHEYMPPGNIFPYAIQLNFSCPNTGHKQIEGENDIIAILKLFKEMLPGVVLIPKFAFTVAPETISRLQPYCDAFCIGNTIPFGQIEDQVDWQKLFKGGISPLIKQLMKYVKGIFPGGLSGAPLFPVLVNWLERMEAHDPNVVIIAGGGIMKKKHIDRLRGFCIVKAIALGSVAITRPWRLQSLIKYGNEGYFSF